LSRWPDGHYTRTLGAAGDKETETEMLLVENDINTNPFTEAVYACLPNLPWDSAAQEVRIQGMFLEYSLNVP
jgi:exosome complex exonuclease DIS3/RRP44